VLLVLGTMPCKLDLTGNFERVGEAAQRQAKLQPGGLQSAGELGGFYSRPRELRSPCKEKPPRFHRAARKPTACCRGIDR
jgi:hypothetical protein